MLIRQITTTFCAFSASWMSLAYVGRPLGETFTIAICVSAIHTAVWTLGYLAFAWRQLRRSREGLRIAHDLIAKRCPECTSTELELTSDDAVHCIDCDSRFVLDAHDGLPRRTK